MKKIIVHITSIMSATIIDTIEAILKANIVYRPVEKGCKIQYRALLRRSQKIKTARLRMLVRISLSINVSGGMSLYGDTINTRRSRVRLESSKTVK